MPEFQGFVREHKWVRTLPMRSIYGSEITVLGTGDIGTSFARRAKAMGAKRIVGVRRSDKPGDLCYDEMYTFSQLDRVLPQTEILVMALPSTPETAGILSRERIALLPPDAIVVNVGRGTAVDQDALMEALNAGRIAGAALDVMVPEPLPADHPLWRRRTSCSRRTFPATCPSGSPATSTSSSSARIWRTTPPGGRSSVWCTASAAIKRPFSRKNAPKSAPIRENHKLRL